MPPFHVPESFRWAILGVAETLLDYVSGCTRQEYGRSSSLELILKTVLLVLSFEHARSIAPDDCRFIITC